MKMRGYCTAFPSNTNVISFGNTVCAEGGRSRARLRIPRATTIYPSRLISAHVLLSTSTM